MIRPGWTHTNDDGVLFHRHDSSGWVVAQCTGSHPGMWHAFYVDLGLELQPDEASVFPTLVAAQVAVEKLAKHMRRWYRENRGDRWKDQ